MGHGSLPFADKDNMSEIERQDIVAKLPPPISSDGTARTTTLKYCSVNPLAPNDIHICVCVCRTAQLTSRCCISNIYSTNILTEYFKHAAHSPFFPLQYAVYFIMLSFLVPVIFTF